MVNHMTEKTALVHQMPFTSDRNGFAATLEKVVYFVHRDLIEESYERKTRVLLFDNL